jgi:Mn2+/Fe2+ NRAMP family transporter
MSGTPALLARPRRLTQAVAVFGPGLVVMLADTDMGSVITAGQSGVQ